MLARRVENARDMVYTLWGAAKTLHETKSRVWSKEDGKQRA